MCRYVTTNKPDRRISLLQALRGRPSLSILQRPAHSPRDLLSGTSIRGTCQSSLHAPVSQDIQAMAAYSSYLTSRFSTDSAWHGRHVLLGAEALNELLVGRLVAGLREEDDLRLAGVDVLRDLVQALERRLPCQVANLEGREQKRESVGAGGTGGEGSNAKEAKGRGVEEEKGWVTADRAVDHEGVLQHLLHGTHEVGDLPAQRNGSWKKETGSGPRPQQGLLTWLVGDEYLVA